MCHDLIFWACHILIIFWLVKFHVTLACHFLITWCDFFSSSFVTWLCFLPCYLLCGAYCFDSLCVTWLYCFGNGYPSRKASMLCASRPMLTIDIHHWKLVNVSEDVECPELPPARLNVVLDSGPMTTFLEHSWLKKVWHNVGIIGSPLFIIQPNTTESPSQRNMTPFVLSRMTTLPST